MAFHAQRPRQERLIVPAGKARGGQGAYRPADSVTTQFLSPGDSWNGTAGTGGTAPSEDTTLRGSGFSQKAIGGFDQPDYIYITDDQEVSVACDTGDQSWIQEVEFWLEGNTATVSTQTLAANGTIGFSVTLDYSAFSGDGDANLYAYIRPVNGYERRVGPIQVTRMADSSRPVRYVNGSTGSDTNNGLTTGTAYKTIQKALSSGAAPSGAIVYCAAGTYLEDSNSGTVQTPARPIEVRPAVGLSLGDVVIGRTSRNVASLILQLRSNRVIFRDIEFDLSGIPQIQCGSAATHGATYINCNLEDPNGAQGPVDGSGYPIAYSYADQVQILLRETEGQHNCVIDSTITNYVTTGGWLYRNATLNTAADAIFLSGSVVSGFRCLKTTASQAVEFETREHTDQDLVVATKSYNSGTNQTTLTFSGSPTMNTKTDQPNQDVLFTSGALAGQRFHFVSITNATSTAIVTGDASGCGVGDHCRALFVFHADSGQWAAQTQSATNFDNALFQRYSAIGIKFQPIFGQTGQFSGAGTISTTGTALTSTSAHNLVVDDFVCLTNGSKQGEYRRVTAVGSSTTATLASAFSADQSGTSWYQGKTGKNISFQACIFDHTASEVEQSQIQNGFLHLVLRQVTHNGTQFLFGTPSLAVPGGFGLEDCVIRDSIFAAGNKGNGLVAMTSSPGTFPTFGITIDNNHFDSGTARGTNTSTGLVTFNGSYVATAGVSRTITSPKLHWNYAGTALALNGTDLVGAV